MRAVSALRSALDVPTSTPLPLAIQSMSSMMGLPTTDGEGRVIPLPEQVAALLEVTGVVAESDSSEGTSSAPVEEGMVDASATAAANTTATASSSGTTLRQCEQPCAVCVCMLVVWGE